MSRTRAMTAAARTRAQRRASRQEIARISEMAEEALAEFDKLHQPPSDAKRECTPVKALPRIFGRAFTLTKTSDSAR